MRLKTGDRIHLKNPEQPEKRVLHSGSVSALENELLIAEFPKASFPVGPDGEFIVFYEARRKFVQQASRVVEVRESESALVVEIELIGDPAPAEGREHYRVTTLSAAVTARLGDEPECPVVDVSSTGFAVLSGTEHASGQRLDAAVLFDGNTHAGTVVVQSIQERQDAKRYGLRHLADADQPSQLEEGLNQISLAIQRQQLARQGTED